MNRITLALSAAAFALVAGTPAFAADTAAKGAAMAKKCALPTNKKNAACIAFKKAHATAAGHDDAMMSDGAMKDGAMTDGAMKHDDAMMSSGDQMKAAKPK